MNDLNQKAGKSGKNQPFRVEDHGRPKNKGLQRMQKPAEPEQGNMKAIREDYDDGLYDELKKYRLKINEEKISSFWKEYILKNLGMFYDFLSSRPLTLKEISEEEISGYLKHLFEIRDKAGFYLTAIVQRENIRNVKNFLTWACSEGIIPVNPLQLFNILQYRKQLEQKIHARRLNLYKERGAVLTYSNKTLFEMYELHLKENFKGCVKALERVKRPVQRLILFCKERGINFNFFPKEKEREYFDYLVSYEKYPSLKTCKETVEDYIVYARRFFRWVYEEGYHENYPFKEWNAQEIKRIFQSKEKESSVVRKRYYSIKELLTSYKKYLRKAYTSNEIVRNYYQSLKFFIRTSKIFRIPFHKVNSETVEKLKEYLFSYEYQPGCLYSAGFQAEYIGRIKRFYDWAVKKGFVMEHPLKEFNQNQYIREIKASCINRKHEQRKFTELIPPIFKAIFDDITLYEETFGFCATTIENHQRGWKIFFEYLEQRNLFDLKSVDESLLHDYYFYLMKCRKNDGKRIALNSRTRHLVAVKRLFQYLYRFKKIEKDPSECIEIPKQQAGLPTAGLNHREMLKLFETQDGLSPVSILRRAVLEFLYAAGCRSKETRSIRLNEIDLDKGFVRINNPKGGKRFQRVVPIGEGAVYWIKKYLREVRSKFKTIETDVLFLNKDGRALSRNTLLNIVKSSHMRAGVRKNGIVCHSMRVTSATELLKGNLNIKLLQDYLGHRSIQSTEKYIRLVPMDLKKAYLKCHPRAIVQSK